MPNYGLQPGGGGYGPQRENDDRNWYYPNMNDDRNRYSQYDNRYAKTFCPSLLPGLSLFIGDCDLIFFLFLLLI